MTREEFVRNRSWILRVIRSRCELTQTEEDYLNDLIEVLEQEPCDCISRKRLKECFHRNVAGAEAFDTIIDMQPSIQPTTKENLVVEDCISRQQAIDKMQELEDEDDEMYGCSIPEGFDGKRAIEALKTLPSIQPKTELETWEGIHAQVTAPKGTFDKIWNEVEEDKE